MRPSSSAGPEILRAIAVLLAIAAALIAGSSRVAAAGQGTDGQAARLGRPVAAEAAGPGPARMAAGDAEADAEGLAVRLIDEAREGAGLVPFRADARLSGLARERSADMRDRRYFGHESPDGRTVFDRLEASPISWSAGGEVIGWNDERDPAASAARVVRAWLASEDHRGVLLALDLNYVGLAAALDPATGRRTWTAVVIHGPDRTAPVSRLRVDRAVPVPGGVEVTLRWNATDVPLSVGTSGVATYTLQERIGTGPWRAVLRSTRLSRHALTVPAGRDVRFRLRATDRAGNAGAWAYAAIAP